MYRLQFRHALVAVAITSASVLGSAPGWAGPKDDLCSIMVKLTRAKFAEEAILGRVPANSEIGIPVEKGNSEKFFHFNFIEVSTEGGKPHLLLYHVEEGRVLNIPMDEFINQGPAEKIKVTRIHDIREEVREPTERIHFEGSEAYSKTPPRGIPIIEFDPERLKEFERSSRKTPPAGVKAIREPEGGSEVVKSIAQPDLPLPPPRPMNEELPSVLPKSRDRKGKVRAPREGDEHKTMVARDAHDAQNSRDEAYQALKRRLESDVLPPHVEKAKFHVEA
ncbi:MAG: hypothetical protein ACXVBW_07740, partial [Bdellovibrionota bacterium]